MGQFCQLVEQFELDWTCLDNVSNGVDSCWVFPTDGWKVWTRHMHEFDYLSSVQTHHDCDVCETFRNITQLQRNDRESV